MVVILPKLLYVLHAFPVRIPKGLGAGDGVSSKVVLKFIWKNKHGTISVEKLKNNNKAAVVLLIIKIHHEMTIIKTVYGREKK